jgi:hypothetical protein
MEAGEEEILVGDVLRVLAHEPVHEHWIDRRTIIIKHVRMDSRATGIHTLSTSID